MESLDNNYNIYIYLHYLRGYSGVQMYHLDLLCLNNIVYKHRLTRRSLCPGLLCTARSRGVGAVIIRAVPGVASVPSVPCVPSACDSACV